MKLEPANIVCPACGSGNYMRYLIHKDGLIHKPYEIKCINCNSYFTKEDIFGNGEETTPKPQTNYDLLISKTPEAMAEWIESIEPAACPWRDDHGDNCRFTNCHDCWLSWLKASAKEEE